MTPVVAVFTVDQAGAHPAANDPFYGTWARPDLPVSDGVVDRTWMWGPEANSGLMSEPYVDSPNGWRDVQYFDKTRMEINNPGADQNDLWFVTNGLLATELMTGRVQVGDEEYVDHAPAEIPVAGDFDDMTGPTYATMNQVKEQAARPLGGTIIEEINRDGEITENVDRAQFGVQDAYYVPETAHNVASVFWEFMNSSGVIYSDGGYVEGEIFPDPFFATGFPLTEAYWATVQVAGQPQDVLTQAFERRILTYTPGNPDGWQVEAGNVGLHYQHWVYEILGEDAHGDPRPMPPALPDDKTSCLNEYEQEFLGLINQYRESNGLSPLQNSAALNVASYKHSEDMGVRSYFAHESPEGASPFDRMATEGYTFNTFKAENIAAGYQSAEAVFEGWRDSSGHNRTMLSPNANVIGIARVEIPGSQYGVYWTTKFGGEIDAAPNC